MRKLIALLLILTCNAWAGRLFAGGSGSDAISPGNIKTNMSSSAMTVACLVNLSGAPGASGDRIADKANGNWGVFVTSPSRTIFWFQAAGAASVELQTSATLDIGTWYSVILTYAGNSTSFADGHIYLNGVEGSYATTTNGTTFAADSTGTFTWGNRGGGTQNRALTGSEAECGAWERVLDLAEIEALGGKNGAFYSPCHFRRSLLAGSFVPMVRDNISPNGAAPTISGTTVTTHPRVIGCG